MSNFRKCTLLFGNFHLLSFLSNVLLGILILSGIRNKEGVLSQFLIIVEKLEGLMN